MGVEVGRQGVLGALKASSGNKGKTFRSLQSEFSSNAPAPFGEPPQGNKRSPMEGRTVRSWPTQGFRCFPTARASTVRGLEGTISVSTSLHLGAAGRAYLPGKGTLEKLLKLIPHFLSTNGFLSESRHFQAINS